MTTPSVEAPGRILGIGGVFFKSADAVQLRSWYNQKLGIDHGDHGATFKWLSRTEPQHEHSTAWSIFPATTTYLNPSQASFMINYIVDDLDAFLAKLSASGVKIDPAREDCEFGKFAWIYDPDGNKLELWQPLVVPRVQGQE